MEIEDFSDQGVSEHTGFPNAATDARLNALDISKILVRRPSSTFYMRVSGGEGEEAGLYSGDIIVIDRAMKTRKSDLVVWWDGEIFAISVASQLPKNTSPWGVITHSIHDYRNGKH